MEALPQPGQVYIVQYNKEVLDRSVLYCAIPCIMKEKYDEMEPCSVRWQKLRKGKPGGFFPSAMIVHIWYKGKEWHTKVNKIGAIHMVGYPDKATAIDVAGILARILNDAGAYVNSVRESRSFREATQWLLSNSIGNNFQCVSTFTLPSNTDLGTMEFCKTTSEKSILWPESVPAKYKAILDKLRILCDDILSNTNASHCALVSRVDTLLKSSHQEGGYVVESSRLCNSIYNTNLGCRINRYELVNVLGTIGYNTHYSNMTTSEVQVFVNIDGVEAKFFFYPAGAVRLSCTSEEVAERAYFKVMKDVRSNLHRISL